jgi:hypothetical protein
MVRVQSPNTVKDEQKVSSVRSCAGPAGPAAPRNGGTLQLANLARNDEPISGRGQVVRPLAFAFPFALGVASGDPGAESVVLWTRLVPEPLHPRGGMPDQPVTVHWELACDDTFRAIERTGSLLAQPENAHCVHVEVDGLAPYGLYWYRFRTGPYVSEIGCTRTLPDRQSHTEALRFAIVWQGAHALGDPAVHAQIARDDLDFVVLACDAEQMRGEQPGRAQCDRSLLERSRTQFARCKLDASLRAAQRVVPWICLPMTGQEPRASAVLAQRCSQGERHSLSLAAEQKAACEHMPARLRAGALRWSQQRQSVSLGPLATLHAHVPEAPAARDRRHGAEARVAVARGEARLLCGVDASPRWQLFVEPAVHRDDARASAPARLYVRCEVDRDHFRSDYFDCSRAVHAALPLEERASLSVRACDARAVVIEVCPAECSHEDR